MSLASPRLGNSPHVIHNPSIQYMTHITCAPRRNNIPLPRMNSRHNIIKGKQLVTSWKVGTLTRHTTPMTLETTNISYMTMLILGTRLSKVKT